MNYAEICNNIVITITIRYVFLQSTVYDECQYVLEDRGITTNNATINNQV